MSTRLHEYEITKSSLLPLHPFVEYVPQRIASDELSKASSSSCGTVYHSPNRKPSPSPGSQRSVSSTRLCVRNENVPLRRDASRSSLSVTPTPISASSRRLARGKLLHRSSWENEPPPARRLHNAPSPLSDPGRLEDVDLGDLHRNDHLEPVQNYGLSFDIKSKENLSTPRHVSDSSQEPAVARKFSVTMDHPFKHDRPFRKWVSNLRQNPRERTRSLTVREARWDLDEGQSRPVKRDLPRRERKSSSWSPFGFVAKGRTPESQVTSKLESQSKKQTGRRFLRSNRNSLVSDTSNCRFSMEDRPTSAQSSDQAPLERALQRRRVLDELLGSEESYVADLKVLLHVGNLQNNWWIVLLLISIS